MPQIPPMRRLESKTLRTLETEIESQNEFIKVDLPETYRTELPKTAKSQYEEEILREISKEPLVEETFL